MSKCSQCRQCLHARQGYGAADEVACRFWTAYLEYAEMPTCSPFTGDPREDLSMWGPESYRLGFGNLNWRPGAAPRGSGLRDKVVLVQRLGRACRGAEVSEGQLEYIALLREASRDLLELEALARMSAGWKEPKRRSRDQQATG